MTSSEPGATTGAIDVLLAPIWWSLTTRHAHLAEARGAARRYSADVSWFSAFDPTAGAPDHQAWDDLSSLVGHGGTALLTWTRPDLPVPPTGWTTLMTDQGQQMVLDDAARLHANDRPDGDQTLVTRDLVDADVPAMLDLVRRTEPGPFLERTIEMGRYLGTFDGDRLVAMAGERMRVPGHTEISAVCTDPGAQGRGLATALVRQVADGILERGETPFLNARVGNPAVALYEHLGFSVQLTFAFTAVRFD